MQEYEMLEERARVMNIGIDDFEFQHALSIAYEDDGEYSIGMDMRRLDTIAKRTVALAHELGHIESCSLYTAIAPFDTVGRCEHRAWKWVITEMLPANRLFTAIRKAGGQLWEVAEDFEVTQELIERAIEYYHTKGITE